jgi:predicted esterase
MSRTSVLLAASVLTFSSAFVRAQTPPSPPTPPTPAPKEQSEDPNVLNRKAIDALRAKNYDEGIAILQRMLDLHPKDKNTAYNLACACSLKGDVDKAFEWMGKACDWGFGPGKGNLDGGASGISEIEMTKTDGDLEAMRKDPRFEALLERMTKASEARAAIVKKGEAYAAVPGIYIPAKIATLEEMPILVVLHDAGSNKEAIVPAAGAPEKPAGIRPADADWRKIADELGFALLAPSGKTLVGDDPAQGMAWFEDLNEYKTKSWNYEKSVNEAVTIFKKDHKIDKTRVFVCGEGVGGLVAVNVAISSPGLYRGALSLNGSLWKDLMGQKAPTAGKMGLKVRLLADAAAVRKQLKDPADFDKTIAGWNKSLADWTIAGKAEGFDRDPKDPDQIRKLVVAGIQDLMKPAEKAPEKPADGKPGEKPADKPGEKSGEKPADKPVVPPPAPPKPN